MDMDMDMDGKFHIHGKPDYMWPLGMLNMVMVAYWVTKP